MNDIRAKIELAWDNTNCKMNWSGLENCLRSILREKTLDNHIALDLIDETIAAFTGRGNERQ